MADRNRTLISEFRALGVLLGKSVISVFFFGLWVAGLRSVLEQPYLGIVGFITFPFVVFLLVRFVLGAKMRPLFKRKK